MTRHASPAATADSHDEPFLGVVPDHPDAPGVPFPHVAEDAFDSELDAIAAARARPRRFLAVFSQFVAILVCALLVHALRYDVRFAISSPTPIELPPQPTTPELARSAHHLVTLDGVPGGVGAVDYRRPTSGALFRLAPLVDQPEIYIELRLPEGSDPTRFVPPTSIRGRLVPLDEAGARFGRVRTLLSNATGRPPPDHAYLLEQGVEPSLTAPAALIAWIALLIAAWQGVLLAGGLRTNPRT